MQTQHTTAPNKTFPGLYVPPTAATTELDIVKRALRNGGAFSVFSLCVNGLWTDPDTRKRVQIEGIATDKGVTLFAANILGSNRIFFVDQILSKSVCRLINGRMAEQLQDELEVRLCSFAQISTLLPANVRETAARVPARNRATSAE